MVASPVEMFALPRITGAGSSVVVLPNEAGLRATLCWCWGLRYAPGMGESGAENGPHAARPLEVVAAFLAGITPADIGTAMDRYAAPDLRFHNVGMPTIGSAATATRVLRAYFRLGTGFVIRTHHLAADGPVVLTDRTDVLFVGRTEAAFHVSGTFEVHDGRITVWRDHFDAASVAAAHLGAFFRAGAGALTSSGRSRSFKH